jgi:hypothetical protein
MDRDLAELQRMKRQEQLRRAQYGRRTLTAADRRRLEKSMAIETALARGARARGATGLVRLITASAQHKRACLEAGRYVPRQAPPANAEIGTHSARRVLAPPEKRGTTV